MRLRPSELAGLVGALQSDLETWNGKLFLFGSRVHSHKKGGDIDLLLLLPDEHVSGAKDQKSRLIEKIHAAIEEQRIDLTIASELDLDRDPFLTSIRDELVRLDVS